ncbi:polymorphic toxin-type HINT domain-containing protein, partial [Kitasatospora sp. NPDC002965]|uniref:polymorphic toxin-type HINT domain-containing protein n=1 Tax=Kitasatospora sp. NPDC002965 TaxID=3154775 RepID=UPI00339DCB37
YEITLDPATTTTTPQITQPANDTVKTAATYTVDPTKTQTLTATDGHPFWLPQTREWLTADKLQPGQWLETSTGTWVQISTIRSHTAHQRVHNLTVSDLHTYYVLAGTTPVLVHNCEVALGWQREGKLDEWAGEAGFQTFSTLPKTAFAQAARKAIIDPNVTLHVNRAGFDDFMDAAQRGLKSGEDGWATDLEMAYIARALANGQRSWSSIKWYSVDKGGRTTMDAPASMPDLSSLVGDMSPVRGGVLPHCSC